MTGHRLVEVDWIDSVLETGWVYKGEALGKASPEAMECQTVGYLLQEHEDFILLAMGEMMASESLLNVVQIPRVAIKGIHDIRRAA